MGKKAVKKIYFELQCQWSSTKSNSFKHKKQNKLKKVTKWVLISMNILLYVFCLIGTRSFVTLALKLCLLLLFHKCICIYEHHEK